MPPPRSVPTFTSHFALSPVPTQTPAPPVLPPAPPAHPVLPPAPSVPPLAPPAPPIQTSSDPHHLGGVEDDLGFLTHKLVRHKLVLLRIF